MYKLQDVDSSIQRWHPDACKKYLDLLEKSKEEDAVTFRKIRDLNLVLDNNFNFVGQFDIPKEEVALYKQTLARKYLLEAHMNNELAKQKKWEEQQAFLNGEGGRRVYMFSIFYMDDLFHVRFDISKGNKKPFSCFYINAILKFNKDETKCISESYECSWRKTKFRKLPKEAQFLIEKVKKDINYAYNLFND